MARIARAVVPSLPHHVTQRGNRRQQTFFETADYLCYIAHLREWCRRFSIDVWAWCLMPNHVHHILVPPSEDALRSALSEAHRRYTLSINRRMGWTGCLWQGRFSSYVMDDLHTLSAVRYIELNPVRAGLVARPEEYPWSSARAHLLGCDDGLVRVAPMLERVCDWAALLGTSPTDDVVGQLRQHQTTGRPLGGDAFVERIEQGLGRQLKPQKAGRPHSGGYREIRIVSPN